MLQPPGWGEAAPNVRFVSAHLGRRLVTERKRKRGDPAWVGEILSNILIQLNFLQDVSQVEGTETLSTAAMRPPGDRVVTGDHCRTPSYNGPNAAKMRLSVTLTTAVTPPTLQVTAPPLTKPRCTLGGALLYARWREPKGNYRYDRRTRSEHCGADTTSGLSSWPPVQIPETNRDRMDCQPDGRAALNRDKVPGEAKECEPRPSTNRKGAAFGCALLYPATHGGLGGLGMAGRRSMLRRRYSSGRTFA